MWSTFPSPSSTQTGLLRCWHPMAVATSDPVRLPAGPRIPRAVAALGFFTARHRALALIAARYGDCFTVTKQRIRLGEWVIPEGHVVVPSITLMHSSRRHFAEPQLFHPDRFIGDSPDSLNWIPFGGGVRVCIGAAFATPLTALCENCCASSRSLRQMLRRSAGAYGASRLRRGWAGGLSCTGVRGPPRGRSVDLIAAPHLGTSRLISIRTAV